MGATILQVNTESNRVEIDGGLESRSEGQLVSPTTAAKKILSGLRKVPYTSSMKICQGLWYCVSHNYLHISKDCLHSETDFSCPFPYCLFRTKHGTTQKERHSKGYKMRLFSKHLSHPFVHCLPR